MRKVYFLFIVLAALIANDAFQPVGYAGERGKGGVPVESGSNQFTPIIVSFLAEPRPVLGSDGKYHLVYELQLTNTTQLTWHINSLEALDKNNRSRVLTSFSGDDVAAKNRIIPGNELSADIGAGKTSLFFITFSVDSKNEIPAAIIHRLAITVPGGIPEGFLSFLSLTPGTQEIAFVYAETGVGSREAAVIGPPLRGGRWVAADGCCLAHRHVRAALPINGKFTVAQRFAIDWEKLNDDDLIYAGDPKDVHSYFSYGEDVLAVAGGRVVTAVDKYEDQVPGQLPPGLPIEEADGNYVVIDIGGGNFAFYAHMIKGSLAVKEGDFVTRGQVIGHLGNSGNTSAPHLHFHMLAGPASLGSNGLPYVADGYELLARSASTEAFDNAEINGVPLEMVSVSNPGPHVNDLYLDQSIVVFPE
ncbi:MAG TPA: M23 family metallopeptidase [Thermodesulfobacteriota bacterium]|nr:M23 family metallopeptidase [Thermodesulfobacteriota bacterium]